MAVALIPIIQYSTQMDLFPGISILIASETDGATNVMG